MELINAITKQSELIIHTDGGSRGNPGPSAIGVVIHTSKNDLLESFGEYIGETTNNQAEYMAVTKALKMAEKYQPDKITFYLDSELVVKQLNGQYKVKNPDLRVHYLEIKQLATNMIITFAHVLREKNKLADMEVNKALDDHQQLYHP